VYGNVAKRTGLVFLGLIVEGGSRWRPSFLWHRMTTDAQQIHLVLNEHALIRGTVRRVADHAAFDLGFVLVDERPLLFRVALVADLVARSVGAQLLGAVGAVRVMAIVALKEAFGDTMMKGTGKLCADVLMAGVAEFRRFDLHQELAFLGVMRRMAVDAT